ncbi:type III secretion system inner rod subunit SctI [Pseudomonas sp. GL-B-16]|uniref:type III secretion system inner rod subunit SctI n=1 Tax=Pseudomonas sp. GL-B-16 TaxID=2832373 RepID=UPI001CBEFC99|nr:type III secretion system inner rod subunit SctI [Pseudomonas sp. GL-B-16]
MTISHIRQSNEPKIDFDHGLVQEPPQADVDLFSKAMRVAEVGGVASPASAMLAGVLADRVQSSEKVAHQAMRHMKSAAKGGDPMDVAELSRELSTYSLQTAVTTKVVNKTAQTLDKLSNLQ